MLDTLYRICNQKNKVIIIVKINKLVQKQNNKSNKK